MSDEKNEEWTLEEYGDHEVTEFANAPVPKFLKVLYVILPIWGVLWWVLFWNGSQGWLDRGYWADLSKAAGTTWVEPVQDSESHNR